MQFVQKKTDVFVNLPTGYRKSLIYQALSFVYDSILEAAGHIVVVVSPLVNLKTRWTNWQILEFLPLLSVKSPKKMQRVLFKEDFQSFMEVRKCG